MWKEKEKVKKEKGKRGDLRIDWVQGWETVSLNINKETLTTFKISICFILLQGLGYAVFSPNRNTHIPLPFLRPKY